MSQIPRIGIQHSLTDRAEHAIRPAEQWQIVLDRMRHAVELLNGIASCTAT